MNEKQSNCSVNSDYKLHRTHCIEAYKGFTGATGSTSDGLREGEQPCLVWIPGGSTLNSSINSKSLWS